MKNGTGKYQYGAITIKRTGDKYEELLNDWFFDINDNN